MKKTLLWEIIILLIYNANNLEHLYFHDDPFNIFVPLAYYKHMRKKVIVVHRIFKPLSRTVVVLQIWLSHTKKNFYLYEYNQAISLFEN